VVQYVVAAKYICVCGPSAIQHIHEIALARYQTVLAGVRMHERARTGTAGNTCTGTSGTIDTTLRARTNGTCVYSHGVPWYTGTSLVPALAIGWNDGSPCVTSTAVHTSRRVVYSMHYTSSY
jgi:hypothetical protein